MDTGDGVSRAEPMFLPPANVTAEILGEGSNNVNNSVEKRKNRASKGETV